MVTYQLVVVKSRCFTAYECCNLRNCDELCYFRHRHHYHLYHHHSSWPASCISLVLRCMLCCGRWN